MYFFPGNLVLSGRHTEAVLNSIRSRSSILHKHAQRSDTPLYNLGIVCLLVSFTFLLVVFLGNAPPGLAKGVYFFKFEFIYLSNSTSIGVGNASSATISQLGLAPYYTVGTVGYCAAQGKCKSFSPFYYNVETVIRNNINAGYIKVPLSIIDDDKFMKHGGEAAWVLVLIAVILSGVAFMSSLFALGTKRAHLVTAILSTASTVLLVTACAVATALAVVYQRAIINVSKEYQLRCSVGRAAFALMYLAACFNGFCVIVWWYMVSRNRKQPPDDEAAAAAAAAEDTRSMTDDGYIYETDDENNGRESPLMRNRQDLTEDQRLERLFRQYESAMVNMYLYF